MNSDGNLGRQRGGLKELIRTLLLPVALWLLSGAGMTAYGAVDWEEIDGRFKCYDKDGDLISDSWIKDGGRRYYMDENGFMVTDQMVEDGGNLYYVGSDGEVDNLSFFPYNSH